MADDPGFDPTTLIRRGVVLTHPAMHRVRVRAGIQYRLADGDPLHLDVYLPPDDSARARRAAGDGPFPVVILMIGYSDLGARQLFGCDLKDFAAYDGWARLIACHGMAAVLYRTYDPTGDADVLYEFLKAEADALSVDTNRVGLWACSGNVPNAIGFMFGRPELVSAAFSYGYTLDLAGHTDVADAAAQFHFANPAAGREVADLPPVPMLLVRAGRDELPGLNVAMDRFHAAAVEAGLPVRRIEHADGPHAFDIFDDSDDSRAVMQAVLEFLRENFDR